MKGMQTESLRETGKTGIDRNLIKYIAMLTMFLNHFAHVFLEEGLFREILTDIGYFTAVTMCFFLVEGYHYTRNRKKYALRLFIFGVITQVPYMFLFNTFIGNMMFTLFLCFCILWFREEAQKKKGFYFLIALAILISAFCDWTVMAAVFTLLFANAFGDRKKQISAYASCVLINFILQFVNFWMGKGDILQPLLRALGASVALVASGIVIMGFYHGKKSAVAPRFNKWFFYVFYPGHIILLWLIRLLMTGKIA